MTQGIPLPQFFYFFLFLKMHGNGIKEMVEIWLAVTGGGSSATGF